ncbi:Uncharacterized protein PECH_007426 [Penicillium ucsense]|uniref:Uncharacterized protein n=1 Tax=Penicillium ucsense TaxID=2839758 RepID=A0A8J8W9C1_9EURO|nr:Uncharacterized protein PECM_000068 [Penicillium ucsense]KAF7734885.1 Uncharacterized protein PECH_007426 [Penicillium ucsense]
MSDEQQLEASDPFGDASPQGVPTSLVPAAGPSSANSSIAANPESSTVTGPQTSAKSLTSLPFSLASNSSSSPVESTPTTRYGNSTQPSSRPFNITSTPRFSSTPSTSSPLSVTSRTTTTTSTSSCATGEDGSTSCKSGPSSTTKIAIAVPVSVVGVLILAALGFFFLRRRRRHSDRSSYDSSNPGSPRASNAILMSAHPKGTISSPDTNLAAPVRRKPVPMAMDHSVHDLSMASTHAPSEPDPRNEDGVPRAIPMSQRFSATEYDPHHSTRPLSSMNPGALSDRNGTEAAATAHLSSGRYSRDIDDDVSEVSVQLGQASYHERDFDDVSSVSSMEGDHPHESRVRAPRR